MSAKAGDNINEVFSKLITQIFQKENEVAQAERNKSNDLNPFATPTIPKVKKSTSIILKKTPIGKKKGGCC